MPGPTHRQKRMPQVMCQRALIEVDTCNWNEEPAFAVVHRRDCVMQRVFHLENPVSVIGVSLP